MTTKAALASVTENCSSSNTFSRSSNTLAATTTAPATTTATTSSSSFVSTPTGNDVLCGRGKATRLHPGNLVYNQLLKDCYQDYQQTPKGSKIDICQKIASLVAERGGRFLEKMSTSSSSSVYYVELQGDRVIAKIAQGFRDLRVAKEGSNSSGSGSKSRNGESKIGGDGKSISPQRPLISAKVASNTTANSALGQRSKVTVTVTVDHNEKKPNNKTNDQEILEQPGRLSFTERVKLFQKEQEKLMLQQQRDGDNETSSDEEEEEEEEDSEEGEDEVESQDEEEKTQSEDQDQDIMIEDDNNNVNGDNSIVNHPKSSLGEGGDVSDTETEDSFPVYRRDMKSGDKNDDDDDDDE